MAGWIKLHRILIDKAIWQCSTPEQKSILITLLLLTNHEEKEWLWQGQKFKAQPGQFVTSIESIAKKAGVSNQNVRSALVKFEKLEFLTNQSTKTGRLITIVNWGVYQGGGDEGNKATNKEVTKHQQSTNKALTPNKNDKNYKNDKNDKKKIYAPTVTMTEEEYTKLVDKFGEPGTKDRIERLSLYKKSKGKQYKCDYSTILAWARKDEKEKPQPSKYRPNVARALDLVRKAQEEEGNEQDGSW